MLLVLSLAATARAQVPDSVAAPTVAAPTVLAPEAPDPPDTTRTPGGALRRALVAPGWGQIYNSEPAKAPFVVVALVGAGAYAVFQNDRYLLYRRAFRFQQREEAGDDPNEFEDFRDEWIETGMLGATQLRGIRDNARSNRDVSILILGVVYALQALDAYVAAELQGFDVSDDLSLRLVPSREGPVLTLRVGL